MEAVLDVAHRVTPGMTSVPSTERLIKTLVIPQADIIMITANNVEMDYAKGNRK